jgi:hypothetical protein
MRKNSQRSDKLVFGLLRGAGHQTNKIMQARVARKFLITAAVLFATGVSAQPAEPPSVPSLYETQTAPILESPIDTFVLRKLAELGVEPASVCSDSVFVRRVYLDVIGALPTAQEAKDFLADPNPNKRAALIDRLLQRDEFADYWAMKWSDLLRVKAEFPINLWPNAVQAYHRWIRTSIKQNKPYDQFARELLTASGSNFRVPEVNFYRAVQSKDPQGIAQAVALTFMGERAENWPKERLPGMAVFFSQIGYKSTAEWKEEIVYFDLLKAAGAPPAAVFPDGNQATLSPDRDPREDFANWLISAGNPWFTRNIANRIWSWLLGRGIVHEPDDARPDNPPVNPGLLAFLSRELVSANYDTKHVYRLILNSQTYQRSSIPKGNNPAAEANFACYPLRRLEAEVLADAICQITGTTERYSSPIPEPFAFIPEDQHSIALADGSTTSSFLEMFGRPARDTGWESERINRPTPAQRLHLLNSSHIQRKLEQGPRLQDLIRINRPLRDTVNELYLTILSRFPTDEEFRIVEKYARSSGLKKREVMIDTAWSLINGAEFLYRH